VRGTVITAGYARVPAAGYSTVSAGRERGARGPAPAQLDHSTGTELDLCPEPARS
jgi:hypothetical protein